jgi:hypothetical protein
VLELADYGRMDMLERNESENYNSNTLDYGILAAILFLVIAIGVFIFAVWVNKR